MANFFIVMLYMPLTFLVHETRMSANKYDCCVRKTINDLERERRKGPVELFLSTVFFEKITSPCKRLCIIICFILFSVAVGGLFFVTKVNFEDVRDCCFDTEQVSVSVYVGAIN